MKNKKTGLEDILNELVKENLASALDEFLEHKILPLLGNYCRGDPLELLSTEEVSRLLGVSIKTVRRLMDSGELKSIRLGKGKRAPLRFRRVNIEAYLNNH
ncbi:MAG: helix-turn-helix domain-containing protein [Cyclobacteriaceae bacterium]